MMDKEASLIGIPRLKSVDDYFTWKDDFTAAMMAKGKVYICMTQGMPEVTARAREEWMEADIKAKGFILQAIGQEYRHLVKSLPTPMEMWQRLQGHFEEHVSLRVEMLQTQLNTIKQKEGEGIDPYSARIAKICEQLDAAGYKTDVDRRMKALVQGLCPEYGVYKAMLMRENDTYRKLIKKEITYTDADGKQHTVTQGLNELDEIERYNDALRTLKAWEEELNQTVKAKDSSKIEMAMSANRQPHGGQRHCNTKHNLNGEQSTGSKGACFKCGRIGHIAALCGKKCYNCNKVGHLARHCKQSAATSNGNRPFQRKEVANAATEENDNQMPNTSNNKNREQNEEPDVWGCAAQVVAEVADESSLLAGRSHSINDHWILDSGASSHMTNRLEYFSKLVKGESYLRIRTATGDVLKVEGIGQVEFAPIIDGKRGENVVFKRVLYVPKLSANLLSLVNLVKAANINFTVDNKLTAAEVTANGKKVLQCKYEGNSLILKGHTIQYKAANLAIIKNNDIEAWHRRLGHINTKSVKEAIEVATKEKLPSDLAKRIQCETCEVGKHTRNPFHRSVTRSTRPLELVHSDVVGPYETDIDGKRYMVTFVDDFSRHVTGVPIETKDKVATAFYFYSIHMEGRTGKKLSMLLSDNGGEFVNKEMDDYMRRRGIVHRRTAPYTPQQNGIAERMNRTVMDMVRCMLYESGLPGQFWTKAAMHAIYVRNRVPNEWTGPTTSPLELFLGEKATIQDIRPFGCTAYVHIQEAERKSKLEPRSTKMINLGISYGRKAYEVVNLSLLNKRISRDITFVETDFPAKRKEVQPPNAQEVITTTTLEESNEEETSIGPGGEGDISEVELANLTTQVEFAATPRPEQDPLTLQEAQKRKDWNKWKEAMDKELESHRENGTWEVTSKPTSDGHVVDCKWVYKLKINPDGSLDKYKARLVARGFTQREGIDYEETFAPVLKFSTLRILIALATSLGLKMEQMDVVTAFLNGVITEDIFMKPPPGYWEGKTLKLKKALYGLKQAGRKWYERLDESLHDMGFTRIASDFGVYKIGTLAKLLCIIAVYVDDIVLVTRTQEDMDKYKRELTRRFKMTEGGKLKYILGLEITWNTDSTKLSQSAYIRQMVDKFLVESAKPATTPLPLKEFDSDVEPLNEQDHKKYRMIVGSLLYASTGTRPDISYATSRLSKHLENPTQASMKSAMHLLRYLKGTQNVGIHFTKGMTTSTVLEGYSDADFAGDTQDRKSTTGIVTIVYGSPVNWFSKKQPLVADSTTVAEYIAMTESVKDIIWTRSLLDELGLRQYSPTNIHVDNAAARQLAADPKFHSRTKHIDVKFHFIREHVGNNKVKIVPVTTLQQKADCLTKMLGPNKAEEGRRMLNMH
ncbi:uncharacterized protein UTRI_10512 [Ustilago trichophora]|uniref:Uncharacterized protein n=1 Tax=Ustilago trichophora TaxID=86804 RepID=A0A5C3EBJ6_9BASI|nr:uncharacterized protein UTRI_10512 [Ustilago trichophora]